jgi:hypothetical protein
VVLDNSFDCYACFRANKTGKFDVFDNKAIKLVRKLNSFLVKLSGH